ncbi:YceI family protein [Noviherbaspirillum saxi]|uniref:YceI family protein n=1 Tax=Noviherbaspirillum saxi TaxID=2320863 RepID=A0A3A3FV86_9BURK|nr:YceI family protein [Noviherbaspirillum saxi]RJF99530.1 YceI family protein [Noviherbaspirillum saxi]
MFTSAFLRRAAMITAMALAMPALAAALKSDPAKSSVSAVFKQMNVPVEAKFKKFNAQIDYDSAKPEASKASIDIDIPSFDLGDAEFNKEAQKKEWFNGAQFPKASFVSNALKPAAGGKLDVVGKLSIKGKTADVSFPMMIKKEGNTQVFEGALPIKRLAFNIGEGEWKDTSMVADEVVIKFRVVATQ